MGGGAKGGSGAKGYNYYGTVAGLVCLGPVDVLQAIILDGKQIITGPITLSQPATDLSLDPDQGMYLDSGGRITLYRGDQTTADPALPGHPAYIGLCYLVAEHVLFGRERTTAPNIQAIVTRRPVVPAGILAPETNVIASDGTVSPVAVLVELLTSNHGLGLPPAVLDASSWAQSAAWVTNPTRAHLMACAVAITSQAQARQVIAGLLEMMDAVLYWTPQGTLSISQIEPGSPSTDTLTIDARHLTDRPRVDVSGWQDVPTAIAVRYPDRDYQWKERQAKADNLVAWQIMEGVPNPRRLDRPHVTSATQAAEIAADAVRKAAQPIGSVELSVRRPFAVDFHPGARVRVDLDPEPGGVGLASTCVVEELREPPVGPIAVRLRPDPLVPVAPYVPSWVPVNPQASSCPPIVADKAVVIPLPATVWQTPSVAVVATRPRADVIGFRILFSPDGTDYTDLGSQPGFAARVVLTAALGDEADAASLALTDGETGPDAYLSGRYPGTEPGAAADQLLLVLALIDGDGRVAISGPLPVMEICSIQTRSVTPGGAVWDLKRARLGTGPRAWPNGTVGWILPRESLIPRTHEAIRAMVRTGDIGRVIMVAYNIDAEDETVPAPLRTFMMPPGSNLAPVITWIAPSESSGQTDSAGQFTAQISITDGDGDLMEVSATLIAGDGSRTDYQVERLAGVGSHVREIPVKVEPGTYTLAVTASDRANSPVTSSRTIFRPPSAGQVLLPPTFTPPGEDGFLAPLVVTLAVASLADRMAYVLAPIGSAQPAGDGSVWVGMQKTVVLVTSRRIWARAGDGGGWGGWVYADFLLDPEPPHTRV